MLSRIDVIRPLVPKYNCAVRLEKRKRVIEQGTSSLRKVISAGLDQP